MPRASTALPKPLGPRQTKTAHLEFARRRREREIKARGRFSGLALRAAAAIRSAAARVQSVREYHRGWSRALPRNRAAALALAKSDCRHRTRAKRRTPS